MFYCLIKSICCAFIAALVAGAVQADEFADKLTGDMGLGSYYSKSVMRGMSEKLSALPYLDAEYGRLFARVDTLGVKTLALGHGYLELVGRISQDGFDALPGIARRDAPLPLGIGTLQMTPLGGVMINAFHDVSRSRGDLFELIYGGQIAVPGVTFYPIAGVEYQSAKYVRYYYGVSPAEAAVSQYASYQPAGAVNGLLGLIAEMKLTDEYYLNAQLRRKWLGDAIQRSPLVHQRTLDTGYIALSYRFK
jgi:outer membrane protein